MSLSLYDISTPPLLRGLHCLKAILAKGAEHAAAKGLDPASLIEARLAPDMFALARQVQVVSDTAKGCAARLAGETPPAMPDSESSFPELQERLDKTIAYLEALGPERINAATGKTITLKLRAGGIDFPAADYVQVFVLPNFYFHVTTAYDILRNQGVPLGKLDYLGQLPR